MKMIRLLTTLLLVAGSMGWTGCATSPSSAAVAQVLANRKIASLNIPGVDYGKNSFNLDFSENDELDVTFSGTDPNTVASEIYGYFVKASAANSAGVTVIQDASVGPVYKAGNFTVSNSPQVTPPLNVLIADKIGKWPQIMAYTRPGSILQISLPQDDSATLTALMIASGIAPKTDPMVGKTYQGTNITCTAMTMGGTAEVDDCMIKFVEP